MIIEPLKNILKPYYHFLKLAIYIILKFSSIIFFYIPSFPYLI
nr:MAG TPA: hypothetical protein [Caudoviricetes sp.]